MVTPTRVALLIFLIINSLQAAFTQLTGDEALYWMYGQYPDFGYRDHPPLIGLMIRAGYFLFNTEFGVRLLVVLANTLTLVVLHSLVRPSRWWEFVLLVFSIPVLSIYGFIATPDVPLMLFAALYLYTWKRFITAQNVRHALWLGLCMAGLVWSKYHGLFIILLLVLPMRKLWFNRYFWMAAGFGVVLYSPHLIWQIANDLPTIKFHLNDRNSDSWEIRHILGYSGGQFAVFNPVVLILVFVLSIRRGAADSFELSLRWLVFGMLALFLLNSFRGRVEPHWTAPLSLAMIYMLCTAWKHQAPSRLTISLLGFFAIAILTVRVFLVFDLLPAFYRDFHRDKNKMLALHKLAGDEPVCFMNSYQNPSLYQFYTGHIAHSINNIEGGKNQYDYWDHSEYVHEKPMLYVASFDHPTFAVLPVDGFDFRIRRFEDLPVMHKLMIRTDEWRHEVLAGSEVEIPAWLINQNKYSFTFTDTHTFQWSAVYNHKKPNGACAPVDIIGLPESIVAGDSVRVLVRTTIPFIPGNNRMCIAVQIDDLPTTYQSNWLRMIVKE